MLDRFVDGENISIVLYLFTFTHNLLEFNNIFYHSRVVDIWPIQTEGRQINAERGAP